MDAADALAASDENAFLCDWLKSIGLHPIPGSIAIRQVLALRGAGRLDEARACLASLPLAPDDWSAREVARLHHERAWFALADGAHDAARSHIASGLRALAGDTGLIPPPERVDLHLAEARLHRTVGAWNDAQIALDQALSIGERLPAGSWRGPTEVQIGYLQMLLGRPVEAGQAFLRAGELASPGSPSATSALAGQAFALATVGRFTEARAAAREGIELAGRLGLRWRLGQLWDRFGFVQYMADRPYGALRAFNQALTLGESESSELVRFAPLVHRTATLAILGRLRAAERARAKAEAIRSRMGGPVCFLEQSWTLAQARLCEARGQHTEVRRLLEPLLADARCYRGGEALLIAARSAMASQNREEARNHAEQACVLGAETGFIAPERRLNLPLWVLVLQGQDRRAIRFAELMLQQVLVDGTLPSLAELPQPFRGALEEWRNGCGDQPVRLTTRKGIVQVSKDEARGEAARAGIVTDLIARELRIDGKTVSLVPYRALEPLLVQLLRDFDQGLTANEVLHAAGGAGPDSHDAEHRVRVLVSRLRVLLGPTSIVTARGPGEGSGTHYGLAPHVTFAIIEPLPAARGQAAPSPSRAAPLPDTAFCLQA